MFPLFILQIFWFFHFSKWIFDIAHLVALVEALECIAPKVADSTQIAKFCDIAKRVIERGEHCSKYVLEQLEELLLEISNDSIIRQFLGRENIGGGSGIGQAWTSAKMHAFLLDVTLWQGGKIYPFIFVESYSRNGITSNDMRHFGHNTGAIFREQIHQIWVNNGRPVTRPTALNEAKVAALETPRRSSLSSSSSSVQTPLPTPRTLTPIATSVPIRQLLVQTPRTPKMTPRANPEDFDFLLGKLWSEKFLSFVRDCYNYSQLERMGHLWVLYDLLNWYKKQYQDSIFLKPILQGTFFDSMRSIQLVEDALTIFLSNQLTENSLWNLRHEPLSKQQDFFEVLQMVIRHELWLHQTQSSTTRNIFIYKCSKGAWVQDPETLEFSLVPNISSQIVEAA